MKKKYMNILLLMIVTAISFVGCTTNDSFPEITEHEFPFYIKYSIGDDVYVIEDTIICEFGGFNEKQGHSLQPIRSWNQKLKSSDDSYSDILIIKEYQVKSFFKNRINTCSFLYLSLGKGAYYMGESEYREEYAPCFYYYESFPNENGTQSADYTVLTKKQLKDFFNIEIIEFSFSPPIKNTYKET